MSIYDPVGTGMDGLRYFQNQYGGKVSKGDSVPREPVPVEDVRPLGGMTVAELISKLQKAPQDALIVMNDDEGGHGLNVGVHQFNGRVYRFDECDKYWSYDCTSYEMDRGSRHRADERPQTFVIISEFSEDGEEL